jgi:hypothetical protein
VHLRSNSDLLIGLQREKILDKQAMADDYGELYLADFLVSL